MLKDKASFGWCHSPRRIFNLKEKMVNSLIAKADTDRAGSRHMETGTDTHRAVVDKPVDTDRSRQREWAGYRFRL